MIPPMFGQSRIALTSLLISGVEHLHGLYRPQALGGTGTSSMAQSALPASGGTLNGPSPESLNLCILKNWV
jgi:hypothetical protein